MKEEPKIRVNLPVHEISEGKLVPRSLRIDGLVLKCLDLTLPDLEMMPQHEVRDTLRKAIPRVEAFSSHDLVENWAGFR